MTERTRKYIVRLLTRVDTDTNRVMKHSAPTEKRTRLQDRFVLSLVSDFECPLIFLYKKKRAVHTSAATCRKKHPEAALVIPRNRRSNECTNALLPFTTSFLSTHHAPGCKYRPIGNAHSVFRLKPTAAVPCGPVVTSPRLTMMSTTLTTVSFSCLRSLPLRPTSHHTTSGCRYADSSAQRCLSGRFHATLVQ